MNNQRSLMGDLDEIANLQPSADAAQAALFKTRAVLDDAGRSANPPSIVPFRERKFMNRRNLAIAASALIASVVFSTWFIRSGPNSSIAFAEVQKEIAKVKTVQYRESRIDRDADGRTAPKMVKQVKILGPHLERSEVSVTAGGDPPKGVRWGLALGEYISINNLKEGKLISLYPKTKTYQIVSSLLSINDEGKVESNEVRPAPKADLYAQIHDVPSDKAKKLDEKMVDGKRAIGFLVEEKIERDRGVDTWTRTYWVDAATKLPVRIEINHRSTNPMRGSTDWVQSDFVFDAPLDKELFSTDPPSGYKKAGDEKSSEKE